MCQVENIKLLAENDIVVYKVLVRKAPYDQTKEPTLLVGPYSNYPYQIGGEYQEEPTTEPKYDQQIDKGFFHAFVNEQDAMDFVYFFGPIGSAVYKAVIPKGTTYYQGKWIGFKEMDSIATPKIKIQGYISKR